MIVFFGKLISSAFNLKEEEEVTNGTSFRYRFPMEFEETLLKYPEFSEQLMSTCSTAIPGIENTSAGTLETNQMVPQGLCCMETYMLISAYDKSKKCSSVIFVLSNENPRKRELITTIVLPDMNHVGGITWDGERLWIAKSRTGTVSTINKETLRLAIESGDSVFLLNEYDHIYTCGQTASYISYINHQLWIGTSKSIFSNQGLLGVYEIEKDSVNQVQLKRRFVLRVPHNIQGVSQIMNEKERYLLCSQSAGRLRSSFLKIYQIIEETDRLYLLPQVSYEYPPMMEEIDTDGRFTYCLFESAASCYSSDSSYKCQYPVDRVCALKTEEIIKK